MKRRSSGERRFAERVKNACLVAYTRSRAAISYLCYYHIPQLAGSRPYPLSRRLGCVFPPRDHFHRSAPTRDLVAVHRSVENESTSCRSPPGDSYPTVPCPMIDTFYAFSTLRFSRHCRAFPLPTLLLARSAKCQTEQDHAWVIIAEDRPGVCWPDCSLAKNRKYRRKRHAQGPRRQNNAMRERA